MYSIDRLHRHWHYIHDSSPVVLGNAPNAGHGQLGRLVPTEFRSAVVVPLEMGAVDLRLADLHWNWLWVVAAVHIIRPMVVDVLAGSM